MSWQTLRQGAPELAEFGEQRFAGEVAYLATIKKDGGPRVHPVTPILTADNLFLFMESTSPKGYDLRRDGRYALHCAVGDSSGAGGEFLITGTAELVEDEATRAIAVAHAAYAPADRYILFKFAVHTAFSTIYDENGNPVRNRWP